MSNQEMVPMDSISALAPYDAKLAEFRRQYDGMVYDLTDPEQNKQARSDRRAIGTVIADLDRRHRDVKAPLLEATRLLDGRRKEIKDGLIDVQAKVKAQITAHEEIDRRRVLAIEERISAIRSFNAPAPSGQLRDRLAEVRAIDLDESWDEFQAEAALAQAQTVEALETWIAEAERREAAAAELERLRAENEARERAERDAKVAAEAEARAQAEAARVAEVAERARIAEKLEAERLILAAKDREAAAVAKQEAAERQRIEAVEKAKGEAERAAQRAAEQREAAEKRAAAQERQRIEAERNAAARKAEAERKADDARKAKRAHRQKIHAAAKASLVDNGIDEGIATRVIEMARDGKIDHVAITY